MTAATCARCCDRPIRWKLLTDKGDAYSCGIYVNAVMNALGVKYGELLSTDPHTATPLSAKHQAILDRAIAIRDRRLEEDNDY